MMSSNQTSRADGNSRRGGGASPQRRSAAGRTQPPRKRRRGRRRLSRAAVILLVLMILICVGITLSLTVLFPVTAFSVSGSSRYSSQSIIDASGIVEGENVFMSGRGAEKDICKRLPYIKSADISRSISGKVTIKVKETKGTSVFSFANKYVITDGVKVLEIADEPPTGLTVVDTAVASADIGGNIVLSDEVADTYDRLCTALSDANIGSITRIELTSPVNIKAVYDDRLILEIGTISDIDKKLQNAVKVIEATQEKYGADVEGTINLKWLGTGSNDSYFSRHLLSSADSVSSSVASGSSDSSLPEGSLPDVSSSLSSDAASSGQSSE